MSAAPAESDPEPPSAAPALRTRPHPASPRPASAAQSGIWFNERLDDCLTVHHLPFSVRFEGDLDVAALRRAVAATVRRHEALASAVEDRAGAPFLVPAARLPELVVERDGPGAVRRHIVAPFDLARGPLCRLVLLSAGPREHRLLVVAHHLVFDGQSMGLLLADLAAFYRAEATGVDAGLPELLPAEAPGAEEDRIATNLPLAQAYWAGHPIADDELMLPGLDRPAHGVTEGESVEFRFPDELREGLGPVARRIGVTRFELIVASLHALLFRYGNRTPVTAIDLGTRTPEQQDRIGVYVNELPFSSAPEADATFGEFARAVRAGLRELYPVRDVPLGRVGAGVKPGVALAQVSMSYRRPEAVPHFRGLTARADWSPSSHTARNALRIEVADAPGELSVLLQCPKRDAWPEAPRSIARHWLTLLTRVVADPDTALTHLPLLDADERERLLVEWNDTAVEQPGKTLPELFAEQVARTPDAVAVVHADRRLSYAELDAAAEHLAHRLRGKGIGPGDLVTVRAKRSERLVVALLGVLKSGAAYIPLDPEYPAQRLEFIAADSKAALELGDADLVACADTAVSDAVSNTAPVNAGRRPRQAAPADLAYVIYTSGSTGRPKGVQIEHRSLTNLLLSLRDLLGARPADRWLALTSVSFDISGLELFLPLVTGATVVVAGQSQTRDGAALGELVARHGITHIQATPTGWAMLLDAGFDDPTVTALTGGEALPPALARRLRPVVGRLVNVYGPTETTIWSTADEVTEGEVAREPDRVAIGRPLANTRTHVLDAHLSPVPVGVAGDLYIAGAGLARGYLGRPDLDRERFLPDPFGPPGSRIYRTGDRARYRDDGRLEFLGRNDDQIKLRGYRIELGEIESRLLAVPGVDRAAAAVRDGRLVAYHVGDAEPGAVRRALAAELAAYMVPEVLVALDALPLTPNGKLDRRALPAPPDAPAPAAAAGDTPLEAVREVWCEVLRLPDIGDTEDLFDLGGHSITMTQISARLLDRLGVDVPLDAYFEDPTVRGIAAVVAELTRQNWSPVQKMNQR
ncbi:amino acid adenylation domain-containing protein [Streptomyces sp. NPDC050516]|uniref:amino acid adenylation domain-containing protein n=1 Tax=Streptomyces sp. NPDC050516 TaxID=3365621 RepID=UPI0037A78F82